MRAAAPDRPQLAGRRPDRAGGHAPDPCASGYRPGGSWTVALDDARRHAAPVGHARERDHRARPDRSVLVETANGSLETPDGLLEPHVKARRSGRAQMAELLEPARDGRERGGCHLLTRIRRQLVQIPPHDPGPASPGLIERA